MSAALCEVLKPVHHAHLLADAKGPYGIEVIDSGIKPLVIRPDRMGDTCLPDLFHSMPQRRAGWNRGAEQGLATQLRNLMLRDRDINLADDRRDAEFWRQVHGLRRCATRVINSLLADLYATIPAEHLRIIRRYPIRARARLYHGLCESSDRAWQLADTFPWLAIAIYHDTGRRELQSLVERGDRLRDIAAAANVPMALRRFKPAVIHDAIRACGLFEPHPYLVAHHCPDTVPKQRAWINAVLQSEGDEDYAIWIAKHFDRIGHFRQVPAVVCDVGDWVRATCHARAVSGIDAQAFQRIMDGMRMTGDGRMSVTMQAWFEHCREQRSGRPFDTRMSADTVLRLSREWHDRQAKAQAARYPFPAPWYDGGTVNGYSILPITDAEKLTHYGQALHNCASSYSQGIAGGECFLYVVERDGDPLAMAEIVRGPQVVQLKGPCNQAVAKPVSAAFHTWLRRQKKAHGEGRQVSRFQGRELLPVGEGCDDDYLPF